MPAIDYGALLQDVFLIFVFFVFILGAAIVMAVLTAPRK